MLGRGQVEKMLGCTLVLHSENSSTTKNKIIATSSRPAKIDKLNTSEDL